MIKKLRLISCLLILSGCFAIGFFNISLAQNSDDLGASTPKISEPLNIPDISVNIPGLTFRESTCTETECTTPWLADYIQALYQYGIGIIGILAVITLMVGGIMWVTAAGNEERVGGAKKWIGSSLIGVLIAFSSYMILNFVNPALTQLSPLKVSYIENIPLGEVELDSKAPTNTNDTTACPAGVGSFNNLVAYFTNINYTYSQPQRGTCEDGKCYCDCSWFAMHLGKCAGLRAISSEGTSASLIGDPNKVRITQRDCDNPPLSPGDIIVWRGNGVGHVLTYIGNNKMIECGGGSFGNSRLESHGALSITDWRQRCSNYLLKRGAYYIKR